MKLPSLIKKKALTLFFLPVLTLFSCLTVDSSPITNEIVGEKVLADDSDESIVDTDTFKLIWNMVEEPAVCIMRSAFSSLEGGPIAEGLTNWALGSLKQALGIRSSFEILVEEKFNEINAKIDSLTVLVRDFGDKIVSQIDRQHAQTQVIPRMNSFVNLFSNFSTTVDSLYPTFMAVNRVSADESKTFSSYGQGLKDLIRMICGVDKEYNISNLLGLTQFDRDVINFAKALLPNVTYKNDIFSDARTYFDYDSVWSHESYPNRETLRTGSLALFTKAKELSELSLLYRLSLDKVNGLYVDEHGNLLMYMIGDQLYMNFDDSTSMVEYETKNLSSGRERQLKLLEGNGVTTEIPFTTLTSLLEYVATRLDDVKYPIIRPIGNNSDLPSNAISLMNGYAELRRYSSEIANYADADLKEMEDNQKYRIHLRLDDNAVTCFNRYNAPFYPIDIQKQKDDQAPGYFGITIPYNCKAVTTVSGYGRAWVNEAFTPTDYKTVSKFISFMPESYRAGSTSTFYDYLNDCGFVFYNDAAKTTTVTTGYMAVGAISSLLNGADIHYIAIDLSAKISEYQAIDWGMMRSEKHGHVIFQGGKSRRQNGKYVYTMAYNNALYNIGFPCYLRDVGKYANTSAHREVTLMQQEAISATHTSSCLFGYLESMPISPLDVTDYDLHGVEIH